MKEINITLKPEVDFSNAQVGDDVFCTHYGAGKIVKVDSFSTFVIRAIFSSTAADTYTISGKLFMTKCAFASLYYFNPKTQEVLYSRPEPEINWAEYEGKMIEVRDTDDEEWVSSKLWKYAPEFKYSFVCYTRDDGALLPCAWIQARLIEEDV